MIVFRYQMDITRIMITWPLHCHMHFGGRKLSSWNKMRHVEWKRTDRIVFHKRTKTMGLRVGNSAPFPRFPRHILTCYTLFRKSFTQIPKISEFVRMISHCSARSLNHMYSIKPPEHRCSNPILSYNYEISNPIWLYNTLISIPMCVFTQDYTTMHVTKCMS